MRRFGLCGALMLLLGGFCVSAPVAAAGGPLGIDHRLGYDNAGVWKRSNQLSLMYLMVGSEVGLGLWQGGDTRLGKTSWQAMDATLIAALSAQALKYTFTRARPSHTDNPNLWFQGGGHHSFPSGEVTTAAAIVTPYVLEFGPEHPWVYGLEVLPAYDAVARMKVHGHWQTDVLAGFALGTAIGYYTHSRHEPLLLGILPDGFQVGLRERF